LLNLGITVYSQPLNPKIENTGFGGGNAEILPPPQEAPFTRQGVPAIIFMFTVVFCGLEITLLRLLCFFVTRKRKTLDCWDYYGTDPSGMA